MLDTYEPTMAVKRAYLYLRKKTMALNGMLLPGLFGYQRLNDNTMFFLGLFLEFFLTFGVYIFSGSRRTGFILAGFVAAIMIDYIFCWVHQVKVVGKINKKSNQKLLMLQALRGPHVGISSYDAYVKTIDANEPEPKFLDRFLRASIYLLALIRIVAFLFVAIGSKVFFEALRYGNTVFAVLFLVVICYMTIAYIHTHHTGYSLLGFWHSLIERNDRKRFFRSYQGAPGNVIERTINLVTFVSELQNEASIKCRNVVNSIDDEQLHQYITDGLVTAGAIGCNGEKGIYYPHSIVESDEFKGIFILKFVGFLTDEQLYKMIDEQQNNPIAKAAVAIHGVSVQLESLS